VTLSGHETSKISFSVFKILISHDYKAKILFERKISTKIQYYVNLFHKSKKKPFEENLRTVKKLANKCHLLPTLMSPMTC